MENPSSNGSGHERGRSRVRRGGLVLLVLVVLSPLGLVAWGAWRAAGDAADYSCLVSIVSHLQGRALVNPAGENASWRDWKREEIASTVSALPGPDCRGGLRRGPDLNSDLRVRTRLNKKGEVELDLWLASRPGVRGRADSP
jgi:hypothetical protein